MTRSILERSFFLALYRVNTDKTQVVIFHKHGKLIGKEKLFYRKQGIDSVKGYKYLEIWLVCNGKFIGTMNELTKQRYESNS